MDLTALTAISPVDGRYRRQVESLAPYFSEFGLIHYRVRIEIEYFIALCEWPVPQLSGVSPSEFPALRALYKNFTRPMPYASKTSRKQPIMTLRPLNILSKKS